MKYLLLSLGGIGDFLETVPSIRALRESCPEDFIGLVVAERVRPYADRCPYVDRVYTCPIPRPGLPWAMWMVIGVQMLILLLRLRIKHFDLMLNFMDIGSKEGARSIQRLVRFINPRAAGGRNRSGMGYFFDRQVTEKGGDGKSDSEYFYAVALLAGRKLPALKPPELWITEKEREKAEQFLSKHHGEGPLVLIHPGSDRETRRWFPQRFAQVASELSRRHHARVLVVGSDADWPIVHEIEKLGRPSNVQALAGLHSVGTLAAVIKRADLLICNDSMAVHVAAAVGTPCVAICASGDVARDRPPWNSDRLELLWKPLECSPCYYWRCPRRNYMECMERISVDEVLKASEKYLARRLVA